MDYELNQERGDEAPSQSKKVKEPQDPEAPFLKLQDLIKRFAQTFEAEKAWRGQKKVWQDFYDGKQLTADEINELESRAQPAVVINKVAPRVDLLVGMAQDNRYRLKAFPRNISEEDISTADAVSQALRFIEDFNQQRFQESEVFEDGCISGRGWFEVTTQFDEDFELDILTKARCSDDIMLDPMSYRYDLSDAKFLFDSIFVPRDDLIALFPDFKDEIERASTGELKVKNHLTTIDDQYLYGRERNEELKNLFIDKANQRIRVSKYWFRTREMRKFFLTKAGVERLDKGISNKEIEKARKQIKKATNEDPVLVEKQTDIIRVQTFISNTILENKEPEFLGSKFPYVPFFFKREKGSGMSYGVVRPMIDPQKEINKRRSKALHSNNTERLIYEEGAVENEDILKREIARPDGIIKKNRGFDLKIESNRDLTVSQMQFYEAANAEIDQVTGVPPDLLGSVTNARSQSAIEQRQRQGLAILNRLYENWKRTRILLEEMKLLFMQEFWTEEKAIRVTDDKQVVSVVPLNKVYVDDAGQLKKLNNLQRGKYDIVIDESEEYINRMQEMFSELAKLSQTGQIPPEIVFEFAPVPKQLRDRLLGRLKEAQAQAQAAQVQAAQAQAVADISAQAQNAPVS